MKMFIAILTLASTLLILPARGAEPSVAAPTPSISKEKMAKIEKMLRLSGMEKLASQMVSQVVASMKGKDPRVPEEFWKRFEERFDARELIVLVAPLYDKYYSTEDLKAVNAFYESPAGQRLLSVTPQLVQESMAIGQKWGEQLGLRIAREMEAETKKQNGGKRTL